MNPTSPTLQNRMRGAIWGQFVGDAAALGTHWIYDLQEMAAKYPEGVSGFEAPLPDHYHAAKQSGDFTHYGDAALLLLESVASHGKFQESDFGQRFVAHFTHPECISYKDHATRETLANLASKPDDFQNGADDDQPATPSRLAPIVVAYEKADDEAFFEVVNRCTRVTQNNPIAADYTKAHAVILRALLRGQELNQGLDEAKAKADSVYTADIIDAALALLNQDVIPATEHFGQSCPLPASFPSAVHAAAKFSGSFKDAVIATVQAGGDNAARATMVGAWLGALHGVEGIPAEWCKRLSAYDRIHAAVESLVSGR